MKEHPLIFSAPMIRAILEGRKSVTRRISKNPNHYMGWKNGDRVWVRECFREVGSAQMADGSLRSDLTRRDCIFKADGGDIGPCRPSIHMPRWASRITLELTASVVREPLQWVSGEPVQESPGWEFHKEGFPTLDHFISAWDSMHPDHPWSSNPTVSVIEFKRLAD